MQSEQQRKLEELKREEERLAAKRRADTDALLKTQYYQVSLITVAYISSSSLEPPPTLCHAQLSTISVLTCKQNHF